MAGNTGGTIRFQFDGDLSGLQRSLTQASRMAKTAGHQMSGQFASGLGRGGLGGAAGAAGSFEERLSGMFTKPRGAMRAERVLGRTIQEAMSGNLSGAVGTLGSRLGGVGIGTVAGIDAAIQGFQKWSAAVDAVQKERLDAIRLTSPALLGDVSGAKGNLGSITDKLSAMRELQAGKGDFGNWMHKDYVADFITGTSGGEREQKKADFRRRAVEDIGIMAKHQEDLNAAEKEGLYGSQRQADLIKERATNFENLQELSKTEAAVGVTNPAARNAENERHSIAEEGINRKGDLSQAASESSIRMAMFQKEHPFDTGASQGMQIREKLGLISGEMAGPMTDDRRNQLSAERIGLEGDQVKNAFEHRNDPGAAMWTPERGKEAQFKAFAADYERTQGLKDAHFDMSGKLIGGTDTLTNKQVDLTSGAFPGGGTQKSDAFPGTKLDSAADKLDKAVDKLDAALKLK